jgi:rubrerythrin
MDKVDETTHIPQALQIALKMEQESANFYVKGIEEVVDPGVKQLFRELLEEEKLHIDRIQRLIDKELYQEN